MPTRLRLTHLRHRVRRVTTRSRSTKHSKWMLVLSTPGIPAHGNAWIMRDLESISSTVLAPLLHRLSLMTTRLDLSFSDTDPNHPISMGLLLPCNRTRTRKTMNLGLLCSSASYLISSSSVGAFTTQKLLMANSNFSS